MIFQIQKEERSVLKKLLSNRSSIIMIVGAFIALTIFIFQNKEIESKQSVIVTTVQSISPPPSESVVAKKVKVEEVEPVIIPKILEVQKIEITTGERKQQKDLIIETFTWSTTKKASASVKYVIEILNRENQRVLKEETVNSQFVFKQNTVGIYKIKVSQIENGQLISFGERSFSLTAPENSNPKSMSSYVMKFVSKRNCYKVDLPSYSTAKKYFIEIYRDIDKKKMVREIWADRSEFCWHSSRDGRYYFRYKYLDYWGGSSRYSKMSEIIFPISPMTDF
ncbi:hypothetical protein [Halobacteriovorax sp. RT-2-6]|uniref:hypothetical protein n=1 Tax=unclassified Halobacteriovorax TaxID=2639665 RepID=UPI00399A79D1